MLPDTLSKFFKEPSKTPAIDYSPPPVSPPLLHYIFKDVGEKTNSKLAGSMADIFNSSSPEDIGSLVGPLGAGPTYRRIAGQIPKLVDMFHARSPKSARDVAFHGVKTENDRKADWNEELSSLRKIIQDNYEGKTKLPMSALQNIIDKFDILRRKTTEKPRNSSKQPDAVYLADEPRVADQYGDIIFKVRADQNKFRPDDDYMHSWAEKEAYNPKIKKKSVDVPLDSPVFDDPVKLLKEIEKQSDYSKANNWDLDDDTIDLGNIEDLIGSYDQRRRDLFNQFLQNPDQYKHFVGSSLDEFGQIAHKGSIPPYRITGVYPSPYTNARGGEYKHSIMRQVEELIDIIKYGKPKLRRDYQPKEFNMWDILYDKDGN